MDNHRRRGDGRKADRESHLSRVYDRRLENAREVLLGASDNLESWHDYAYEEQMDSIQDAVGPAELYSNSRYRARLVHDLASEYVTSTPNDPNIKLISGSELVDRFLDPRNYAYDDDDDDGKYGDINWDDVNDDGDYLGD